MWLAICLEEDSRKEASFFHQIIAAKIRAYCSQRMFLGNVI